MRRCLRRRCQRESVGGGWRAHHDLRRFGNGCPGEVGKRLHWSHWCEVHGHRRIGFQLYWVHRLGCGNFWRRGCRSSGCRWRPARGSSHSCGGSKFSRSPRGRNSGSRRWSCRGDGGGLRCIRRTLRYGCRGLARGGLRWGKPQRGKQRYWVWRFGHSGGRWLEHRCRPLNLPRLSGRDVPGLHIDPQVRNT